MSDVYELREVECDKAVKRPQQIEALLGSQVPWGDLSPLVFMGTSDATLHCLVPPAASSRGAVTQLPSFLRAHKAYKKIFHTSACFLDSWGVYATLQDAKVTLYALPLHTNPRLDGNVGSEQGMHKANARVADVVVADESKTSVLLAAQEEAKTLCALSKTHVLRVFDWTVSRSLELRAQHNLTQTLAGATAPGLTVASLPVQKMILMGESHAFLLGKKDWCVINLDSGKLVPVRASVDLEMLEGATCAVPIPSRQRTLHFQASDVVVMGKHYAVVLSLVEGPAAEKQDEREEDGSLKQPALISSHEIHIKAERAVEYNVAPKAVYYHHPFLLLDQIDKLSVYSIGTLQLVQSVLMKSLNGACALSSLDDSNRGLQPLPAAFCAVSATPYGVQLLTMKPIRDQVAQARLQDRLGDAVALCKLCPEDCGLEDQGRLTLFAEFAVELFGQAQFTRAMSFWLESQVEVAEVLQFFPRDLLPRSMNSKVMQSTKRKSVKANALQGEPLVQSLLALIVFLRQKRERSLQRVDLDDWRSTLDVSNTKELSQLEMMDTVLLKCLVLVSEKPDHRRRAQQELQELVRNKNWCDLGETEIFLRAHRQFDALLIFYSTRKLHRKVLELLEDLERNTSPALKRSLSVSDSTEQQHPIQKTSEQYMQMIAEYLRRLDHKKADLVFEFSRHVIAVKPTLGLSIFTQRAVPRLKEDIDPALILNHLKSCQIQTTDAKPESTPSAETDTTTTLLLTESRFLAVEYLLQVILSRKKDLQARLHDEVVYLLLDAINAEVQSARMPHAIRLTSRVSSQRGLPGLLRRKLLEFLSSPNAIYHPERMLSRTPIEMVDERAALLSKLERHQEVLQLYALELKDASLAELYCNKCYEQKLADSSIYSALLRLYLRPSAPSSSSSSTLSSSPPSLIWQRSASSTGLSPVPSSDAVAAAVNILNKYAERIDVPTALELLPSEVPVASLEIFFRRVLERQVERFRNGQVKKQLSKMENFKIRELLSTKRKGSVTVWSSHCCQVCGKKLGVGTFVRLPGGTLLHYACQPAP